MTLQKTGGYTVTPFTDYHSDGTRNTDFSWFNALKIHWGYGIIVILIILSILGAYQQKGVKGAVAAVSANLILLVFIYWRVSSNYNSRKKNQRFCVKNADAAPCVDK